MFSIIISLDNNFELSNNFFENLFRNTNLNENEIIIVVDGCKEYDTINYIKALSKKNSIIKLIILENKVGYAKANNIGVKYSKHENLVFINTDVLPTENSIEKLVDYMLSNGNIGVAQGRLIYPQNNTIQSTGHTFAPLYNAHLYKGKKSDDPIVLKTEERQALTSAFYTMRKQTFYENGGFDEQYYNAYEGMELSLKINKSGLKCMYYHKAVAYHATGGARNNISYDNNYASNLFWTKWNGLIKYDITDYLKQQNTATVLSQNYYLVNCSRYPFWIDIVNNLDFKILGNTKISNVYSSIINLYYELSYEMLKANVPLLFTVDDMNMIKGNYHWCNIRNQSKDIVIDGHGNFSYFSDIVGI